MVLLLLLLLLLFAFAFVQVIDLFNTLFFSRDKKSVVVTKSKALTTLYYDMSTLAETLADPSRPSFLFGGSIFRVLFLLSLSLPRRRRPVVRFPF